MEENKAKWMSIGEAAKYLGVSRDTLRRWEKKGKIKAIRSPSNRRYYTKKILDESMTGQTTAQKASPKVKKPKIKVGSVPKILLIGGVSFVIAVAFGLAVVFFLL